MSKLTRQEEVEHALDDAQHLVIMLKCALKGALQDPDPYISNAKGYAENVVGYLRDFPVAAMTAGEIAYDGARKAGKSTADCLRAAREAEKGEKL